MLFAGIGAWLIGNAVKVRREEQKRIEVAPAVGRSNRGTVTAGFTMRF